MSSSEGWRSTGGGRPAQGDRSWRHSRAPAASGGVRWMLWFKRGLAVAGVVVCLALIIALFVFRRPFRTQIALLAVPEYTSDALPLNDYAGGDVDAVEALVSAPRAVRSSADLTRLDSLDKLTVSRSPHALILYANVIGGVDQRGIFLLPRDASADDPGQFLQFEALLEKLGDLGPKLNKLLVLDVSRTPVDWRLGQLAPPDILSLSERVNDVDNLVLMSACGPGQQSWTSAQLRPGQSVFGHFLIRGLAGEADSNADEIVSVSELFGFVQSRSAHWVLNNRHEQAQHPVLVPPVGDGDERDFALIRVITEDLSIDRDAAETGPGWSEVERLREDVERLNNLTAIARLNPLAGRDVWRLLDRSEDALRAGQPNLADDLLRRAQDRSNELRTASDDPAQLIANYPFLSRNLGRFWKSAPDSPTDRDRRGEMLLLPEELLAEHLRQFQETYPVSARLPGNVLERIVEVRRLAEQAGAVPVGTLPWVRDRVEQADGRRRAIEDRLFLRESAVDELTQQLDEVAAEYEQAIDDGETVESARRVWETVSLELPALAEWAAWRQGDAGLRQRLVSLAASNEDAFTSRGTGFDTDLQSLTAGTDDRLNLLEPAILRLFSQTRRLQRSLDAPANGAVDADALATLRAVAESVDQMAADVRTRLRTEAAERARQVTESPQPFHRRRIVEALRAPGLPARTRRQLNEKLRDYEQQMADKTRQASGENTPSSTAADEEGLATAHENGLWHGLWILQVMSLAGGDEWEPLAGEWRHAADAGPHDRRQRLIALGERIRSAWGHLRQRVGELIARKTEYESRRRLLVEADRISRVLHASDIGRLDRRLNPAQTLFDYDLTQALLWHADRHLEGFWAAPGERSNFWFQQVVDELLKCASRISGDSHPGAVRQIDKRRKLSDQRAKATLHLALSGPDLVRFGYVGGRQSCTVDVQSPQEEMPQGQAALWLVTTRPQDVEIGTNGRGVETSGSTESFALRRTSAGDDGGEDCDPFVLQPVALFRGHQWSSGVNLTIEPCRATGRLVTTEPAPQNGEIKVQGRDQRAVMFVLDCSGSMAFDVSGGDGTPTKFKVALDNLESIIRSMDDADRVGLVAFAHRVAVGKGGPPAKRINEEWKEKVGAIDPGLEWDRDYQQLVPLGLMKDNRGKILDWIAADREPLGVLRETGAHGNTPLVGAIREAIRSLPPGVTGGTIVAITDGEAQDDSNTYENRVESVKQAIRSGRADVRVVGFGIEDTQPLEHTADKLGCNFTTTRSGRELVNEITKAIQPRPYSLLAQSTEQVLKQQEIGQAMNGLSPGRYKLQFGDFAPLPVEILGGERLQLTLDHEIRSFVREGVHDKPRENATEVGDSSDGRPTFLAGDFFLEADTATVTLLLSHDDRTVIARRPKDVLFEILPQGSNRKPTSITQSLVPGTEPTWKITLDGWPERTPAVVQAWWKTSHTPPDHRISLTDAQQALDEQTAHVFKLSSEEAGLQTLRLITQTTGDGRLQVHVLPEEAPGDASEARRAVVEDLRIELGTLDVYKQFQPEPIAVQSDYSDSHGDKIFKFDVTAIPEADRARLYLGITTAASRKDGAIHNSMPLVIY